MADASLEARLTELERRVAKLAGESMGAPSEKPWWKRIVGVYKDDPEFDEAERLGREYRESLRPKEDEDIA